MIMKKDLMKIQKKLKYQKKKRIIELEELKLLNYTCRKGGENINGDGLLKTIFILLKER